MSCNACYDMCVCVCIIRKSYRSICKIKMSSKPGCHYRYTPTTTTTTTTSTLDKFCTCIKFNCKKSPSFLLCLALRQQSEGRRNLCVHVVQIRHNRPFLATYDYVITMITILLKSGVGVTRKQIRHTRFLLYIFLASS